MNSHTYTPKTTTEDLIHSITKNTNTFFEQTKKKPKELLEFMLTKPYSFYSFDMPS